MGRICGRCELPPLAEGHHKSRVLLYKRCSRHCHSENGRRVRIYTQNGVRIIKLFEFVNLLKKFYTVHQEVECLNKSTISVALFNSEFSAEYYIPYIKLRLIHDVYDKISMFYRGSLDYSRLVTDYWPEFGANGKDNVTVEMLISHQVSCRTVYTVMCHFAKSFIVHLHMTNCLYWSCEDVCDILRFPLDSSFIKFGNDIYKQVTGIPMGANYALFVADLFLFCYEGEFMKNRSKSNDLNLIEKFNNTSLVSAY